MATDKRAAERKLEELLMTRDWHRSIEEKYREKGNASGEERCDQLVKADNRRIREHCAEHGLELPHDVPPEDAA